MDLAQAQPPKASEELPAAETTEEPKEKEPPGRPTRPIKKSAWLNNVSRESRSWLGGYAWLTPFKQRNVTMRGIKTITKKFSSNLDSIAFLNLILSGVHTCSKGEIRHLTLVLSFRFSISVSMDSSDTPPISKQHLDTLSDSVHNTLQQFMVAVDSKMANLRAELRHSTPVLDGSSSTATPPPCFAPPTHRPDNLPLRSMKLEAPRFDGSNPIDWLLRIEAFFDYHGTPADARLQIVAFHLEDRAATWFQWARRNGLLPT
ncbi:hypothetical protein L484_014062 [Morus notabilis]|uniref:Retrotransposon gag domain-containing protein n=1 Tax=Morus notabilis TaxID=981085 RepID=W9QYV3_9ROSA|nr:hypothetical protein L484_014062 [Morus notabilis]